MRIMCIGDSNTWGHDPVDWSRIERRWPKVLAELLPEDEIIEEGMDGRTFIMQDFEVKERCGLDSFQLLLRSHTPLDLVIVMLGTNDFKKNHGFGARAIAYGAMTYMGLLKNPYIYEVYQPPKAMFISPIMMGERIEEVEGPAGEFDLTSRRNIELYKDELEKVCKEIGAYYMAASDFAKASEADQVHMTADEHVKLAKAVADKINEIRRDMMND